MSRRIAVTGATGFIGGHLIEHLRTRGDAILPISVRAPCDPAPLVEACRGVDTIVHLGGVVSSVRPDDFVRGNVESARAIADVARSVGAHLVHVSSLAAAGPASPAAPRDENAPETPITVYGRTKLEGERLVTATPGLQWTILRPGVVYGPRDRALRPLFRFAHRGFLPLVGRHSAAYTFIHIDDLVRTIAAAIDARLAGETMFVGHPRPVGTRELLETIRSASGTGARILPVPTPLLYAAAIAGDAVGALTGRPTAINRRRYVEIVSEGFVCRVDRLRERLGIVARVDLGEGIASAAAWYRSASS